MDAAATYAGSFFGCSDAVLYQGGLQELDRFGKDGFFVVVTIEQQIMDFCADRGTGVLQIIRQKIVCGDIESVGDHDQEFKTWGTASVFDVAKINGSGMDNITKILLGHLPISSVSLDAFAYA